MNWINELKGYIKIRDVISRYLPTRSSSGSFIVKCPFHQEKTPSMNVNVEKNMFYCFGCGVGGDSISFVQKIEKITFIEACKKMADWYGVQIRTSAPPSELVALQKIAAWTQNNLEQAPVAKKYLYSRGLTDNTINKFKIGYFASDFMKFCSENNLELILEKIGFRPKIIGFFVNRISFPIYNQQKQVVGFGARALDGSNPKYINTSGSDIFQKKSVLYGSNVLSPDPKFILMVEGYFDVCICAQSGLNAVAPMGTAFSMDQVEECWEHADEVVICFDGDDAGRKASAKMAYQALNHIKPGKIISFLDLPNGEDPGTVFTRPQDDLIQTRLSLLDKLWDLADPKSKISPEKSVLAYNSLIESAEQIKDPKIKFAYIKGWKEKWFAKKPKEVEHFAISSPKLTCERILMCSVLYYPEIFDEVCDYVLSLDLTDELYELREFLINEGKNLDLGIDSSPIKVIFSLVESYPIKNLVKIAPFLSSAERVIGGWFEAYSLYFKIKKGGYK